MEQLAGARERAWVRGWSHEAFFRVAANNLRIIGGHRRQIKKITKNVRGNPPPPRTVKRVRYIWIPDALKQEFLYPLRLVPLPEQTLRPCRTVGIKDVRRLFRVLDICICERNNPSPIPCGDLNSKKLKWIEEPRYLQGG